MDCLYYIWLDDDIEEMPDVIATVSNIEYPALDMCIYLN